MTKRDADKRLERFNVVLSLDDIAWLDRLSAEILVEAGAKLSRSEIIRAALATMRELHDVAPHYPNHLAPLTKCTSGGALAAVGVFSVRQLGALCEHQESG